MSRCFAYPPPGFSLQRGSELVNEETKKDRKRENKGRGKEKKETSKGSFLPEKKVHKRGSSGPKVRSLQKLIQSENEQLERSSLTEELEQPVGEPKPSTSSDSTENSSKRKRGASALSAVRQEEHSKPSNGNIIRIRLPLHKRNVVASKQEPYSITRKRTKLPSHEQTTYRRTELPSPEQQVIRISRERPCSTSGRSGLATSKTHLEWQDNVPFVQQGHNNVLFARPPRREVNKVSPASVPSVNRQDTPAFTNQMPENKLLEGALPHKNVICLQPPRREANKVSSALGPSVNREDNRRKANKVSSASGPSVNREDNGAFIGQMSKNKLPGAALPPRPDEKFCSPLGVPEVLTRKDDIAVHETKSLVKKVVKADVSPLGIPKSITRKDDIVVRDLKSFDNKMVKADLRYRDLFLNLVPPPPQTELQFDDQNWLFSKKKNPDNQSDKKLRSSNHVSRHKISSLWPHAQFIPEADVYALPFTVPF